MRRAVSLSHVGRRGPRRSMSAPVRATHAAAFYPSLPRYASHDTAALSGLLQNLDGRARGVVLNEHTRLKLACAGS